MGTLALSVAKEWPPADATWEQWAQGQALKHQSTCSTPAKVNARIREFCGPAGYWLPVSDKTFAKAYKEFRKVTPELPCAVEDWHVSKWVIVRDEQSGELTLAPTPERPVIAKADIPYTPAAHWTRRAGPPKVKSAA